MRRSQQLSRCLLRQPCGFDQLTVIMVPMMVPFTTVMRVHLAVAKGEEETGKQE